MAALSADVISGDHFMLNAQIVQHLFHGCNHWWRAAKIIFDFRRVLMEGEVDVVGHLMDKSRRSIPLILRQVSGIETSGCVFLQLKACLFLRYRLW